jgi:hypothetical protein
MISPITASAIQINGFRRVDGPDSFSSDILFFDISPSISGSRFAHGRLDRGDYKHLLSTGKFKADLNACQLLNKLIEQGLFEVLDDG